MALSFEIIFSHIVVDGDTIFCRGRYYNILWWIKFTMMYIRLQDLMEPKPIVESHTQFRHPADEQ